MCVFIWLSKWLNWETNRKPLFFSHVDKLMHKNPYVGMPQAFLFSIGKQGLGHWYHHLLDQGFLFPFVWTVLGNAIRLPQFNGMCIYSIWIQPGGRGLPLSQTSNTRRTGWKSWDRESIRKTKPLKCLIGFMIPGFQGPPDLMILPIINLPLHL